MSTGKSTFSSAESVGMRLKNWNTKPIRSRLRSVSFLSESPESSVPPTTTRPDVGLSRAPRMCKSVLFPDPEGPMMAANSPVRKSQGDVLQGAHRGRTLTIDLLQAHGLYGDAGSVLHAQSISPPQPEAPVTSFVTVRSHCYTILAIYRAPASHGH